MEIQYICLSDLHLGAEYSLLTNSHPRDPSLVVDALAQALDELLGNLPVTANTRLILLGDILDMGFSDTEHVVNAFSAFSKTFFHYPNLAPLAANILFIPGNHDHELWQEVRTHHLLDQISQDKSHKLIQATNLTDPGELESRLLQIILRKQPGLDSSTVQVAYPNFAQIKNHKCVVFSHGHYIESTYLAISELKELLTGEVTLPDQIAEIERENGYWVNALWSNIGNAGFGGAALEAYETMLDAGASHEFVKDAADRIRFYLEENYGLSDEMIKGYNDHLNLQKLCRAFLDVTFSKFSSGERYSYLNVLSESNIEGLKWYLSKPLLNQFSSPDDVPPHTTFVFGHTHKPFESQLPVEGYKEPVNIYNTGGWAIDKPVVSSVQGASAIFVDDSLNVVSLRLFNCSPDQPLAAPSANGVHGYPDEENPLLELLRDTLQPENEKWAAFTSEVSAAIDERQKKALMRYFRPHSKNGVITQGADK